MIVFHEGLPRAGKSYEAVLSFIVPFLRDGTHVYTNIRGVDPDKIAAHLGIAPVFIRERLHVTDPDASPAEVTATARLQLANERAEPVHLTRQKEFFRQAQPGSLIVWDEIQNFFPTSRQQPPADWIEFVAQHGHLGLHIVIMGQDIKDVHPLWRRRVEQKIRFTKLSMIGRADRYRWEISRNRGSDRWEAVDSGIRKYDPKVCALYQSTRPEGDGNYLLAHDKGSPLQRSIGFRYALPAFGVALVLAVFYVVSFFRGEQPIIQPDAAPQVEQAAPGRVPRPTLPDIPVVTEEEAASERPAPAQAPRPSHDDYLESLFEEHTAYVTGFVGSVEEPTNWVANVTFYDRGSQPVRVFTRHQLQSLAAEVEAHPVGIRVRTVSGKEHFLTHRAAPENIYTTPAAVSYYQRENGAAHVAR